MKKLALIVALTGAVSLGGCAKVVGQLQAGTTALINFNNALIQLNITVVNNLKAQAQQLAPLVCGGISLGKTLASDPIVANKVNSLLTAKERANSQFVTALASDLCAVAGLPTNVTAVPASASIPAAASDSVTVKAGG